MRNNTEAADVLENLHRRIDHAALKPDVDEDAVQKLCDEARRYKFYSVAINPVWVTAARKPHMPSAIRAMP